MEVLSKQKPTKKTNRRHRRCNTILLQQPQHQPTKQRDRCNHRHRCRCFHHYHHHCARIVGVDGILTAFCLAMLIAMHVCYGDQIQRDPDDIDTMSLSQVQFKKHHSSRQVANIGLTLHDSQLLRDETINGGDDDDEISIAAQQSVIALVPPSSSSAQSKRAVHVSVNKSNGNFKSNTQTMTTTTASTHRINVKRDRHRKVLQSRNLIGNASSLVPLKKFTQYKYAIDNTSYYASDNDGKILSSPSPPSPPPLLQLHKIVPSAKPKIQLPAKLFNPSSSPRTLYDYHRTPPSYSSYNLGRDRVQKTQTSAAATTSSSATAYHQQSNKNSVYETYYRPVLHRNRNRCNQCQIIPGTPQRFKPYAPNRAKYNG